MSRWVAAGRPAVPAAPAASTAAGVAVPGTGGGGGGGGASDVRRSPLSDGLALDPRLLVAPGGGGGGASASLSSGGAGGAPETAGSPDSSAGIHGRWSGHGEHGRRGR